MHAFNNPLLLCFSKHFMWDNSVSVLQRQKDSYFAVRVCKHPGEDLTKPLQLHAADKQKQETKFEIKSVKLRKYVNQICITTISASHLSILWLLSRFCSPSSPSFLSDQLALAQWFSTSATSSVCRRKCGAMPPLRELYERSEQALEASLLASSSEYIPGDSKRRLTGLR